MKKYFSFLIFLTLFLAGVSSCKKSLNGNCNKDNDCKSGLICEGHKCRKHIDCELLKSKYEKCISRIMTVRNPSYKPSAPEIKRQLQKFNDSYYKECVRERGAYDDPGIDLCLKETSCGSFAKCLLNLEKH